MYSVKYSSKANSALQDMDSNAALLIVARSRKLLEGCDDPRKYGKRLQQGSQCKWMYCEGYYRIIAHISDEDKTILILDIVRRGDVCPHS